MKTYTIVRPRPRDRSWNFHPLSKVQRSTIGRLATAAYSAAVSNGTAPTPTQGKTAAAQSWRHGQYREVTGVDSLDSCDQGHFRALCAHFNSLIGTPAAAARSFRDSMRSGPVNDSAESSDTHEGRDLWEHLLRKACGEFGLSIGYAASICQSKYKCALTAATADQLRKLTFDVRRNGQRRAAMNDKSRDGEDVRPHSP